ncbi:hypothetical protein PGH24_07695 [Thermoanaerobacterium thermosaccharolyticum]|uniref:acyltransferase n=1 Tax=Thermoanaerobacterium thermosaccharolyticum TaxID=1517 RepID=UPI0027A717A1|nr:hypothetical protein PGH24_07695 [Thermoanaerobacterium thermosaccharolyticum]
MVFLHLLVLFFVNKLSGVHFFTLKRYLLNKLPNIEIGEKTKIVGPIYFNKIVKIKIGKGNWIGRDFRIDGNGMVSIGDNNDFAPEILIVTGSHKCGNKNRRAGEGVNNNIIIGSGNWIGTRTTIIEKASLGNGNIIGAQTLIKDVFDDDNLIVGIPGIVKRKLYND